MSFNNCEKSQLRNWSKMWKIFYVGENLHRCHEIETTVMNSRYADSTKRKWRRDIDQWIESRGE